MTEANSPLYLEDLSTVYLEDLKIALSRIVERLRSDHQDRVYVAEGYTKGDLIRDLEELAR